MKWCQDIVGGQVHCILDCLYLLGCIILDKGEWGILRVLNFLWFSWPVPASSKYCQKIRFMQRRFSYYMLLQAIAILLLGLV